ncbi:hypothetical protein Q1695_000762 [Nippostrongylus brasiliensis]|nr:hypothetical protein Q1695_000762 [Nippostrongylus brasiliensis]
MWLVCATVLLPIAYALRMDKCETRALGMESGAIGDNQITSSSSFDQQSVGPQNARIRTELASGAWCPKPQIHSNSYEFLQISLEKIYVVTAIETQGRYGNGTGREYVSEYMIDYLRPGSKWIRYRNRTGHTLMTGNYDTTTAVKRALDPPLFASKLRIVPHSRQTRTICLRVELYGCVHDDGLLYYSTLPGGSRVGDVDFRDSTFENSDLYTETGIRRGLGLLSDGYVAETSPFDERNTNGSWIGWSRHNTDGTVTLLFEFDHLRNFSEILMAAYGRLNSIDVIFSQDGTNFSLSSQISSLSTQSPNSTGKRNDLRIPLHKRMAKKIRVTISFVADWIFLTEIHFTSVYYNEQSTMVSPTEERYLTNSSVFVAIGLVACLVLLTATMCIIVMRRRKKKPEDKYNIFERDIRRNLIITQIHGKTTTELLPSPPTPSHAISNLFSSGKTTSTSLSSKSTSPKFGTATWSDFHFPPPPSLPDDRANGPSNLVVPMLNVRDGTLSRVQPPLHELEKVPKIPPSTMLVGVELGKGKNTVIRECYVPAIGTCAYKSPKDRNSIHARNALLDEMRTLFVAKSPHIIQLLAIDDQNGLLLELAANGNIRQYLQSQPRDEISIAMLMGFCADVCEGMRHLETLGLVHGHLTPSNILIDEHRRAKVASPRGPSHHAQLRYSAPESILNNSFSPYSDVWAFAVCCWEIAETLCTRVPFAPLTNSELVENAQRMLAGQSDRVIPSFTECIPRGVRNVLVRCFDVEPQSRPLFTHISYFMSKYYSAPQ